jgi:uncharacterized phage protein (TIGR01671 family)
MNNRFNFRMWDINTKRFYYMYLDELIGLTRTISIPKEATIQQYTGLTDSNDKEIYEGDILMYKSGSIPTTGVIGQVLYEADEGGYIFQWERKGPNQHHINLNCDVAFESVIVGNILENPELLK